MHMCWDAQTVVFLRSLRMAQGGARAEAEAQRMITEKVAALAARGNRRYTQGKQATSRREESISRVRRAGSYRRQTLLTVADFKIGLTGWKTR
jgi:hypothetical protein